MPLGTVDQTPPPFFRQGASALSKLMVFSALAALLMVLDSRLQLVMPLRSAISTALLPLQWLALQPVKGAQAVGAHFSSLQEAQADAATSRQALLQQVQRSALVEHLEQENRELRDLLGMHQRLALTGQGAEVLYDVADPYSRKVIIDHGQAQGTVPGSAVLDGLGVLGQITRVYPMTAEVTLLIDRDQAIPVLNTRTGQRSLAYGQPTLGGGQLELRYLAANTDIAVDDLLTTSGVDGVYPAGLPVARVAQVSRDDQSGFARVVGEPLARMDQILQVLVVPPVGHGDPVTSKESTP